MVDGTAPPSAAAARESEPVPLALAAMREEAAQDNTVIAVSADGVAAVAGDAAPAPQPEGAALPAEAAPGEAPPPPQPEKRMTLAEKFRSLKEGVRG